MRSTEEASYMCLNGLGDDLLVVYILSYICVCIYVFDKV